MVSKAWLWRSSAAALLVVLGLLVVALARVAPSAEPAESQTLAPQQGGSVSDVLILGDSLCVFSRGAGYLGPQMDAHFDSHDTICKVGGNLTWGSSQILPLSEVPEIVVVELGTNRMPNLTAFTQGQDALVAQLRERGARKIIWLTAHTLGTTLYYAQNDITRDAGGRLGFLISDWATLAEASPWWYLSDTVHHTQSGMAALAIHLRSAAQLAEASDDYATAVGPVVDHVAVNGSGLATIDGWALDQSQLVLSVDGLTITTRSLSYYARPDVQAAMGLVHDMVGFTVTVQLPDNATRVCVAPPGEVATAASCKLL